MEHSLLHALLLAGLMIALGGPLAALLLWRPVSTGAPWPERTITRWVVAGALIAAGATLVDFLVQTAEAEGQTVFGGLDFALAYRFALETEVGRLGLWRVGVLLVTAAAAAWIRRWWLTAILALASIIVTTLVSHAAAQPQARELALVVQGLHLAGVAAWIGVLFHLWSARTHLLQGDRESVTRAAEIVRRFSPMAFAATAVLALTGLYASVRYLGTFGSLLTSPYGLTLSVKLGLLMLPLVAGFLNFWVVRPALLAAAQNGDVSGGAATLKRFGRLLELEVLTGFLVITVAGIVGSLPPPAGDAGLQLSSAQVSALLSPDCPTTEVGDWTLPENPDGPTLDDLRYSEFTHNWSGVVVTLLGLGWLLQAAGGRTAAWAAASAPWVLVPFGFFIALASNPELWLLRHVSAWEALTNPQLLEHQLGAVLVLVLAWLSWRDRRRDEATRPLGYALPVVMIAGSLLLLGHAHAQLTVPDDLTTLINVQHAVLGACGLFGGTLRLLILRDLFPRRLGNWLWPLPVIALGLFLAFFYREIV